MHLLPCTVRSCYQMNCTQLPPHELYAPATTRTVRISYQVYSTQLLPHVLCTSATTCTVYASSTRCIHYTVHTLLPHVLCTSAPHELCTQQLPMYVLYTVRSWYHMYRAHLQPHFSDICYHLYCTQLLPHVLRSRHHMHSTARVHFVHTDRVETKWRQERLLVNC